MLKVQTHHIHRSEKVMNSKTLAAILIVTVATVVMVIIYKKRMGEQILASRRNMISQCNARLNVARSASQLPQIDLEDLQATAGGLAALSGNVIDSAIKNQRISHLSDIFGDALYVSGDGSNANQSEMPYLPPTGCGMECLKYMPAPVNEWNDGDGQQRYHM